MKQIMFDLNDTVKVSEVMGSGYFTGVIGVVKDVTVEKGNTIYGLELIRGNEFIDKKSLYAMEDLVYFLAIELELV